MTYSQLNCSASHGCFIIGEDTRIGNTRDCIHAKKEPFQPLPPFWAVLEHLNTCTAVWNGSSATFFKESLSSFVHGASCCLPRKTIFLYKEINKLKIKFYISLSNLLKQRVHCNFKFGLNVVNESVKVGSFPQMETQKCGTHLYALFF